jgi:hypothetical protein
VFEMGVAAVSVLELTALVQCQDNSPLVWNMSLPG